MYGHVCFRAIMLSQNLFNLGGLVVGLTQGDVARHQDVELDGIMAADAPCTQVVGIDNAIHRSRKAQNLFFHLLRQ